jgi:hypothetical protein
MGIEGSEDHIGMIPSSPDSSLGCNLKTMEVSRSDVSPGMPPTSVTLLTSFAFGLFEISISAQSLLKQFPCHISNYYNYLKIRANIHLNLNFPVSKMTKPVNPATAICPHVHCERGKTDVMAPL